MGFLKDALAGLTKSGAEAARKAAGREIETLEKGRVITREAGEVAVAGVEPFAEAGREALPDLISLVTDPEAQRRFIEENPFFTALAERSTRTLLQNQAAKGKVGSGETAEALQTSLVLLGSDLLSRSISQRQDLARLGFAGAQQAGEFGLRAAGAEAGTLAQIGATAATGIIGARQAETEATEQVVKLATLAVCDRRAKENIIRVGKLDNGLPLYLFNYIGDLTPHINVMAQDVEKVNPDAVIEIDGVKHINMEKVVCPI